MEIEKLLELVDKSLNKLYENEKYLFECGVSERNLVFHFSRYFIELFEEYNKNKIYSVDCEYNRNAFNEKKYKEIIYGGESHIIFPDFILHQRGNNRRNLLAIEFKKESNNNKSEIKKDSLKLKALTDKNATYMYKLGLLIILGKTRNKVKIKKYINGVEV